MKTLLVTLLLLTSFTVQAAPSALQLSFMEGRWQGKYGNLTVVSHYIAGNWQVFMGRTYWTDASGKTAAVDLMRVEVLKDNLVLEPFPMGQPSAPLLATFVTSTSALFANKQSAFPSRVIYMLDAQGGLVTRFEGVKDGKATVVEYRQTKI